jgi:putative Holliday junction resolvase
MGRLLGIDYGSKRVGIAVTDELRIVATPLDIWQNDQSFWKKLADLVVKYGIEAFVLGFPASDKYREASDAVEGFRGALARRFPGMEIFLQNERFSSVIAEGHLRASGLTQKEIRGKLDKYAAQKILEDYLREPGK